MRITFNQLIPALNRALTPVYLLTGAEPLQLQEAHTVLLEKLQAQGFTTRQRFDVMAGFDWSHLLMCSQNMSLFSDKQVLDVSLSNGKPGTLGSDVLCSYAADPPLDTVLIVRTGKLEAAAMRSKWVKAIEKAGVVLQVWPITLAQIPQWLNRRLQQAGIKADKAGLQLLADRIEGNLLAGAQAVEKLQLCYGQGNVTVEQIANTIGESAQYDVFALVDACLQGNTTRCLHILSSLQQEGSAPAIVLWALVREIRMLAELAFQLKNTSLAAVLAGAKIWEKRKSLIANALQRISLSEFHRALEQASFVDRTTKGIDLGEPWEGLSQLCLQLSQPQKVM